MQPQNKDTWKVTRREYSRSLAYDIVNNPESRRLAAEIVRDGHKEVWEFFNEKVTPPKVTPPKL